mgnify:FL=1|jgi:hypothetical protein|nr:MAG TPA: AAA domain protein [Caudoviricetes sp.]
MIKRPDEVVQTTKKIRMIIAGFPGIGKTTLGLSAPKPLLIDVDRGIDRVQAKNRKDFTQPISYEELLQDLKSDLSSYETLVFDTGGKLLDLMKPYVIKQDSKNGQKDGTTLSIKGYGAVGKEFQRLMDYAYYNLNKNVVVLFHAKEDKDGEATKLRILVEGSTKDNVWQPMDLGGFMEMYNGKRTIGFDNCERYYAKGTHGVKGVIELPDLDNPNIPNDFLTKLFEKVNESIREEATYFEEQKKNYEKVMSEVGNSIENMTEENIDSVMEILKTAKHVLTSEKELRFMFKKKIESLGMVWDFDKRKYVKKEVENEPKEISDNSKPIE